MARYTVSDLNDEEVSLVIAALARHRGAPSPVDVPNVEESEAQPTNSWSDTRVKAFTAGIGANFKRFLRVVADHAPNRVEAPTIHAAFRMWDGSPMPSPNARGAFGGFDQRVNKFGDRPWDQAWNAEKHFQEYWMDPETAKTILRLVPAP